MNEYKVKTPVAYIVFNRLEVVKKSFEEIRKVQPPKLYIISDGPREQKSGEKEVVLEVRRYIESHIDWDCDVKTNYSDYNMGCKKRVASGISWCFESEEELIIIEDDIITGKSFFEFCEQLLEHYRHDEKIMCIGGYNPRGVHEKCEHDYFFIDGAMIWGWATWKRAWSLYDIDIKTWPETRKERLLFETGFSEEKNLYTEKEFDLLYDGKIDTWDIQWNYAVKYHGGLGIVPKYNLIENIGFGNDATHTSDTNIESLGIRNELQGPINFRKDHMRDYWIYKYTADESNKITVKKICKKIVPQVVTDLWHRIKAEFI